MTRRAAGGEGEREEARGLFDAPAEPRRCSVAELTSLIKQRVDGIGRVRVEGELAEIKRAASGHVYFTLKDESARLSCVVWKTQVVRALALDPAEGMQVVAQGRLEVYAPRGTYSLIVERLERLGIGALLAQLEALKAELKALGWFERKRALPASPTRIGLVTSRDGAALRDFLRTRSLRWPGYPVILAHTAVQGAGAAPEIAAAIRRIDGLGVDVIVVARGGGSLEDLWAFNERVVAEAIFRSSVPVVTGVGHETDVTLADLVADHRAHTPTDAAQTVIPDRAALMEELERLASHLAEALERQIDARSDHVGALRARLLQASRTTLARAEGALSLRAARLERQAPRAKLERWAQRVAGAGSKLALLGAQGLERAEQRAASLARALDAVSPLAVLARGYSVTTRKGGGEPLLDAGSVALAEELETRLARGTVISRVVATNDPGGGATP